MSTRATCSLLLLLAVGCGLLATTQPLHAQLEAGAWFGFGIHSVAYARGLPSLGTGLTVDWHPTEHLALQSGIAATYSHLGLAPRSVADPRIFDARIVALELLGRLRSASRVERASLVVGAGLAIALAGRNDVIAVDSAGVREEISGFSSVGLCFPILLGYESGLFSEDRLRFTSEFLVALPLAGRDDKDRRLGYSGLRLSLKLSL